MCTGAGYEHGYYDFRYTRQEKYAVEKSVITVDSVKIPATSY